MAKPPAARSCLGNVSTPVPLPTLVTTIDQVRIDPVHDRHFDVHQDDFWLRRLGLGDSFCAVACAADDLESTVCSLVIDDRAQRRREGRDVDDISRLDRKLVAHLLLREGHFSHVGQARSTEKTLTASAGSGSHGTQLRASSPRQTSSDRRHRRTEETGTSRASVASWSVVPALLVLKPMR